MSSQAKFFLLTLFLALTVSYAVFMKQKVNKLSDAPETNTALKVLPSFVVTDLKGNSFSSESLFSKDSPLTIVHFWGTWCAPCEVEFPSMVRFIDKFKGNSKVRFLLIAVNDELDKIKRHQKRYKDMPENVLWLQDPSGQILEKFGTVKVPETYVFNHKKEVVIKFAGPQDWDRPHYFGRVKSLIP